MKTSDGKTVTSSTAKPANAKYSQSSGVVGDNGYQPKFTSGYSAPAGSVIYYPQHSFLDYLPWIYLFSHDSPRNDAVTVVQPDGKQVEAKPEEGFDGLAVLNWIVLVVIALAVIAGVVWLVQKLVTRNTY